VVIKLFFLLLVLGTAAVVAVILAIHFRVKRHLRQTSGASTSAAQPGSEQAGGATQPSIIESAPKEGAGEIVP
jgi:hypothetical protein